MGQKMLAVILGGLLSTVAAAKTYRDLAYVTPSVGPERWLDLFLPDGPGPFPLVIFVHGGAWISGDKSQYRGLAAPLVREKLAVAMVNYRLSAPGNAIHHPLPVEDLAAAVSWLNAAASKYALNPNRYFVAGHSAGAHMAAFLCFDEKYHMAASRVHAFVGMSGIYDLPGLVKRFPSYVDWFVSLAFGKGPGSWAKASPMSLPLKNKAPWYLVHSLQDELVDPEQSERFYRALLAQGIPVKRLLPREGSHGETVTQLDAPELVEFFRKG